MPKFVTVATFQYPHEAHIIKSKLEAAGIFVLLKDELTVQAHNFLSNAIGGVKLQVEERDVEKAFPILREAGLIRQSDAEGETKSTSNSALIKFFPFLKNYPAEIRTLFLIGIILVVLVILISLLLM